MTMTLYLVSVFIIAAFYAFILTTKFGRRFTDLYPWLAFSLGELIIIGAVAVRGYVDATELFLLNAAGALPMVARWVFLNMTDDNRRTLRTIYGETQTLAGRGGNAED